MKPFNNYNSLISCVSICLMSLHILKVSSLERARNNLFPVSPLLRAFLSYNSNSRNCFLNDSGFPTYPHFRGCNRRMKNDHLILLAALLLILLESFWYWKCKNWRNIFTANYYLISWYFNMISFGSGLSDILKFSVFKIKPPVFCRVENEK